jgi:serine protease Do
MRPIDKLLIVLVLVLLAVEIASRTSPVRDDPLKGRRPMPPVAEAPGAPNPSPPRIRRPPLAAPSATDPPFVVATERPMQSTVGTAFAVDDRIWMTARHVIEECPKLTLFRRGEAAAPANVAFAHPTADLGILESERGGPPIQFESRALTEEEDGYVVGFPHGVAGAAYFQLLGRSRMQIHGWLSGGSPALSWAEVRRFPESLESLGGMSGGPMVDADGRLVGIMVSASIRRGRADTVAPEVIAEVRKDRLRNGVRASPLGEVSQGAEKLEQIAHSVVDQRRVGLVYCGR